MTDSDNIRHQVLELQDEVIRLRRDFHQHPELGQEEVLTSNIIVDYLTQQGISVERFGRTGVVGFLEGIKPGHTLLMRADIDALPIQEQNDLSYRSVHEGVMHACGHDGHIAMLLVAVSILSRYMRKGAGNIVFVFQPNEENAGALDMIEQGLLNKYPADASVGIHLWPGIKTGSVGISVGPVMAGTDHFEVKIIGKAGHTGNPQAAIDPVLCAADIIKSLQMIQTREINVLKPTIIMVGKIVGGTAGNVIPGEVFLEGTTRYLYGKEAYAGIDLQERIRRVIADVCHAHRTRFELSFPFSHPAVVNDPKMTEIVRKAIVQTVERPSNVVEFVTTEGDDFSEFSNRMPGVYYFVGCGNIEKQTTYSHHHPMFNIDEDALAIGVETHVRSALLYLSTTTKEE